MTGVQTCALPICLVGCGTAKSEKKKDDFFTSGSREADQRASQRMAKDEQLAGSGEGAGEKSAKKAVAAKPAADGQGDKGTNKAAQVEGKLALFDRLGGEKGITSIVDDFTPRVLQDPRVNWQRKGVKNAAMPQPPQTFKLAGFSVWVRVEWVMQPLSIG